MSITIAASQEFRLYEGGTYHGSSANEINHAVTATGYGTDEQGHTYWLLKNLWGTWGENGFVKMIRDTRNPGGHCDITKFSSYPIICYEMGP